MEAKFKIENSSVVEDDQLRNMVRSEFAEFHMVKKNIDHQNDIKAVVLEKIPKIETQFNCSDDDMSYPNDHTDSSLDSADLQRDPFADVDFDPSFLQTLQSHNNYIDSGGQYELHKSADNANQISNPLSSSSKRILPSKNTQRNNAQLTTQCKLCLVNQSSKDELKIHTKICATSHKNRHRFCASCNKLFASPRLYRTHALKMHGIKELKIRLFKCSDCPRSKFAREDSFEAHLASHRQKNEDTQSDDDTLKLKLFKCSQCTSRFKNLDGLRTHMVSHTDDGPFKCAVPNCGKSFIYNCHLKDHIRRFHSDQRPFKCPEPNCDKAFNHRQNLSIHLATIHVQKDSASFECPEPNCNKKFKTIQYVRNHLRNHSCRHKCTQPGCSAIFGRPGLLKSHIASKH